jgi:hypothetical protein
MAIALFSQTGIRWYSIPDPNTCLGLTKATIDNWLEVVVNFELTVSPNHLIGEFPHLEVES